MSVPDGGAGLPLVNWSTEGGDLRIAHALGLHGLQFFPILGLLLERKRASVKWLSLAFALYVALMAAMHLYARAGEPLIPLAQGDATSSQRTAGYVSLP